MDEKTPLRTLIDYAESVANRELVPQGFARAAWRDLPKESRFYVRMLDMEARGTPKVADSPEFPAAEKAVQGKLRLIEQGYLGGSGGYAGRCRDWPASHPYGSF